MPRGRAGRRSHSNFYHSFLNVADNGSLIIDQHLGRRPLMATSDQIAFTEPSLTVLKRSSRYHLQGEHHSRHGLPLLKLSKCLVISEWKWSQAISALGSPSAISDHFVAESKSPTSA